MICHKNSIAKSGVSVKTIRKFPFLPSQVSDGIFLAPETLPPAPEKYRFYPGKYEIIRRGKATHSLREEWHVFTFRAGKTAVRRFPRAAFAGVFRRLGSPDSSSCPDPFRGRFSGYFKRLRRRSIRAFLFLFWQTATVPSKFPWSSRAFPHLSTRNNRLTV